MAKGDLTGEKHAERLRAVGIRVPADRRDAFDGLSVADVAALVTAGQLAAINETLHDLCRAAEESPGDRDLAKVAEAAEKFAHAVTINRSGVGRVNTSTKRDDLI